MLKIGWSRRDVSSKEKVNLPGQFHARISKGILDPLFLHCLVLDDGSDLAVFLSGDFVSGRYLLDLIRTKVQEKRADFPVEKILFHVTHTHAGADLSEDNPHMTVEHPGVEIYPAKLYREFVASEAADAILEAFENREEGAIAYGYGYAVVAHHRRPVYKEDWAVRIPGNTTSPLAVDGFAKMYGPTNDEMFAGYEGGADHYVNLMYTFDKNEKLTGAIINVPCPSQNSEAEYHQSADYWHDVRALLHEKYGDIYVLSQCAAAGDLSPRALHYKEAQKRRYALKFGEEIENAENLVTPEELYNRWDIAERICEAFDEVLSWAKKDLVRDAEVRHTVKTVELPKRLITEKQYVFAKEQIEELKKLPFSRTDNPEADMKANTIILSKIHRFHQIVERYEKQLENENADMELHVIRVGDIAFASNAYELYLDFQHQIQARSPFLQTFIIQLSDQPKGYCGGYLATEKGIRNHGYSATIYCNQISPAGGEKLVEETLQALRDLK